MEKNILAQQLKKRLLDKKLVSEEVLNALSDDQVIASYVTCSCCKVVMLDDEDLKISIKASKDAEDFLKITDEYSKAIHKKEEINKIKSESYN